MLLIFLLEPTEVNNLDIIIAYDPTGNIDSIPSEKVIGFFKRYLQENPKKSIISVTYDPKFRKSPIAYL